MNATTMAAVVIRGHGGPDVVEIRQMSRPEVGMGQVKVEVRATSLNFRDIRARRFATPDHPFPMVAGSDFAGVIVDIAKGVNNVEIGQRVVGMSVVGAHAEEVVTLSELVTPLPEGFNFESGAAMLTAGLSALLLIERNCVESGSTVVTTAAAGGLGCYLGNLLADKGARAIGITSTPEKAEVARSAGYTDVVVHRLGDPVESVLELTNGRGVDIVFDAVAGPQFARSFSMLADGGTLVVSGRAAGEPDLAQAQQAIFGRRRNLAVRDFSLETHLAHNLDQFSTWVARLAGSISRGGLAVPMTEFSLNHAAEAHRQMETGSSVGKLVLIP